jgi:hypothetical protein
VRYMPGRDSHREPGAATSKRDYSFPSRSVDTFIRPFLTAPLLPFFACRRWWVW